MPVRNSIRCGTCLAAVILAANSAFGADAVEQSPTDDRSIILRALGPHVNAAVVSYVARNAEPATFSGAAGKTPREIVLARCGSFRDDYFAEVRRLNQLPSLLADDPLGPEADQIKWPACFYVRNFPDGWDIDVRNIVRVSPTADIRTEIFRQVTGGDGTSRSQRNFFMPSDSPNTIRAKFFTAPVGVVPVAGVTDEVFLESVRRRAALANAQGGAAGVVRAVSPMENRDGEIVTPIELSVAGEGQVEGVSLQSDTSRECLNADATPFDPLTLANTFKFALRRSVEEQAAHAPVYVTIVDNGFFGANPPAFVSYFPQSYFPDAKADLGPQIGDAWPINYRNGFTAANINGISGHGTHVTGLAIGGPYFDQFRDSVLTRQGEPSPWLRLTLVNIGRGRSTLVANSTQALNTGLRLSFGPGAKNRGIVNMSISYLDNNNQVIQEIFRALFTEDYSETLFVVAAGNHQAMDVADAGFYPAALGGLPNVITVAAHNNEDQLPSFSDRGNAVSIAAPGCGVRSWLADDGRIEKLSGTSQAAPFVTFAAALLKSIAGQSSPAALKQRILASGDLLDNVDSNAIASQSKLSIRKALYVFDDYVRIKVNGQWEEWLGRVTNDIPGMRCSDNPGFRGYSLRNLYAYKRRGDREILFYNRSGDGMRICSAKTDALSAAPPKVSFSRKFRVGADGAIENAASDEASYSLADIEEIIRSGPLR